MRKMPRDPVALGSLDLFSRLDAGGSSALSDASRIEDFLHRAREGVQASLANDARLHGWHTGRMFGEVLKALGGCALIKEEDQGDAWVMDESDITAPDFRAVLPDMSNLLIEVKNFFEPPMKRPLRMARTYLARLQNYAQLTHGNLKFAIYWAQPGIWTLVDPSVLVESEGGFSINFFSAFTENEMGLVGDMMIATEPPLSLVLKVDQDLSGLPRDADGSVRAEVRIKGVSIRSSGRTLKETDEHLAWYLLMFCDWQESIRHEVDGDVLRSIVLDFEPEEWIREQGHASLGYLSQFFSRQFWLATTRDESISSLQFDLDPTSAGFNLARDHRSAELPLWRFTILPKSRASEETI